MSVVKNNSDAPLGLPGGPVVPAKTSIFVPDFKTMESNDVVKAWLDSGMLEVSSSKSGVDAEEKAAAKAAKTPKHRDPA